MNIPAFLSVDPQMLKSEERIIVASIGVFADFPVENASLRMIAKKAGISFSAITYYFKTKENLYKEAITRILNFVVSSSPSLNEEFPQNMSRETAKKELLEIVRNISERIYGNTKASVVARILFREHLAPTAIYDQLFQQYFTKIITRIANLVQVLCKKMDTRRANLQAFSIIGQIIAFRFQRELMIRQLDFTGFSPEEIEELEGVLEENIFRQLGVQS